MTGGILLSLTSTIGWVDLGPVPTRFDFDTCEAGDQPHRTLVARDEQANTKHAGIRWRVETAQVGGVRDFCLPPDVAWRVQMAVCWHEVAMEISHVPARLWPSIIWLCNACFWWWKLLYNNSVHVQTWEYNLNGLLTYKLRHVSLSNRYCYQIL